MLGHQEDPGQVDADPAVPRPQRKRLHRRIGRVGKAGVVDQGVQPAEAAQHRPHAGPDRRFARDVAAEERGRTAIRTV
jgi:hypothetical protein